MSLTLYFHYHSNTNTVSWSTTRDNHDAVEGQPGEGYEDINIGVFEQALAGKMTTSSEGKTVKPYRRVISPVLQLVHSA